MAIHDPTPTAPTSTYLKGHWSKLWTHQLGKCFVKNGPVKTPFNPFSIVITIAIIIIITIIAYYYYYRILLLFIMCLKFLVFHPAVQWRSCEFSLSSRSPAQLSAGRPFFSIVNHSPLLCFEGKSLAIHGKFGWFWKWFIIHPLSSKLCVRSCLGGSHLVNLNMTYRWSPAWWPYFACILADGLWMALATNSTYDFVLLPSVMMKHHPISSIAMN